MNARKWRVWLLAGFLCCAVCLMARRFFTRASRVILAGNFHSVAHKGTGEAQIAERMDGTRELRLIRLKTYPAGDLDVCMVGAPDAEDNATVRKSGKLQTAPVVDSGIY